MTAIARELGLSVSRVSRLIARAEEAKKQDLTTLCPLCRKQIYFGVDN